MGLGKIIQVSLNSLNKAFKGYRSDSFGQKGMRIITNGYTPVTGEVFTTLVVIEDSTITATNLAGDGSDNLTAEARSAGHILYGVFPASGLTVASGGKLEAYKK